MVMTAGAFLAAAEALPKATLQQVAPEGGLLVIAPHPDDESLGCGGLLAAAAAAGRAVAVVVVSDGAASHNNSRHFPAEARRRLRQAETEAALRHLGLPAGCARYLGLPDAAVPDGGPAFEAAVAAIVAACRQIGASTVLVTWAHDPHCDHKAAHAMACAAMPALPGARLWSYPVWGHTLPPETALPVAPPEGVRLDIAPHLPAKRLAVLAHRSQRGLVIDDDPEGFVLSEAMLQRFARPHEILLRENEP